MSVHLRMSNAWKAVLTVAGLGVLGVAVLRAGPQDRWWTLVSWLGGGCILLGSYKVITLAADYIDDWLEHLYWRERREREAAEAEGRAPLPQVYEEQ